MEVAQPPSSFLKESIDGPSSEVHLLEGMFLTPALDPLQVSIYECREEKPTRRPNDLSNVCQQAACICQVEVRED
jgi:hypothetical protein